jgi:hypothetical protein
MHERHHPIDRTILIYALAPSGAQRRGKRTRRRRSRRRRSRRRRRRRR